MRKLMYRLFALFFNLNRIFPVKRTRVALLAPHPLSPNDSLSRIETFLKEKGGFEIIKIEVPRVKTPGKLLRFMFCDSASLARAKFVFLNDNFMPLGDMKFSSEAVVTQLWHGEGAFKKFGFDLNLDEGTKEILKKSAGKYSYVTCTGENVKKIYAGAFGVDESKVIATGSPRDDFLFKNNNTGRLREDFDRKFPACKGKKLVLYAPTFRENEADDANILNSFDAEKLTARLGEEYAVLIKLHPRVHSGSVNAGLTDVTGVDISLLTLICDTLITDYSSVCMDFALLNKKCVFYAYDLEKYEAERSFYFDYEDYVPGEVVKNSDDLPAAIKNPPNAGKTGKFREFNFDYFDDGNTQRLYEAVIQANL